MKVARSKRESFFVVVVRGLGRAWKKLRKGLEESQVKRDERRQKNLVRMKTDLEYEKARTALLKERKKQDDLRPKQFDMFDRGERK